MSGRNAKAIRRKVDREVRNRKAEILGKSLQSTFRAPLGARLRLCGHILLGVLSPLYVPRDPPKKWTAPPSPPSRSSRPAASSSTPAASA